MGKKASEVGVKMPRVSIIVAGSDNGDFLRRTIDSVVSQDYADFECIPVISRDDAASTELALSLDVRVVRVTRYDGRNLYRGVNDAITSASGEWVCILRAGDRFASRSVLSAVFRRDMGIVDVVYGDSVSVLRDGTEMYMLAEGSARDLAHGPFYYLGSGFIRAQTINNALYDDALSATFHNMLDYVLEFKIHANGGVFLKVPIYVTKHPIYPPFSGNPGLSVNIARISGCGMLKARVKSCVSCMVHIIALARLEVIARPLFHFVERYLTNYVVQFVPIKVFRTVWLRMLGARVGKKTEIDMRLYVISPRKLFVGSHTHINRSSFLDARGTIRIGNCVSISHNVSVITGSHDIQSPSFTGLFKPVRIGDYVFIGANATILQGVTIGEGAVVAAGAVVTKDIPEYEVYGGNPAKRICSREHGLAYTCASKTFFS